MAMAGIREVCAQALQRLDDRIDTHRGDAPRGADPRLVMRSPALLVRRESGDFVVVVDAWWGAAGERDRWHSVRLPDGSKRRAPRDGGLPGGPRRLVVMRMRPAPGGGRGEFDMVGRPYRTECWHDLCLGPGEELHRDLSRALPGFEQHYAPRC